MRHDPEDVMNRAEHLLEHSDFLGSLARHLVRDAADADDLVQETWAAALSRTDDATAPSRSWLGTVLRNFAYLRFRGDRRRISREHAVARAESVRGPEDSVQKLEVLRWVVDAVLALEAPSRDIVILRYFDGLSGAEIARRMDLKPSTVRMRLKRALDELRAALDAKHDGDRSAWHLGLAVFLPAPAGPMAPETTGVAGGAGAATLSPVWITAATVGLGLAFAGGWASRSHLAERSSSKNDTVVIEATSNHREQAASPEAFRDAIGALEEARETLELNQGSVEARLATLEEIVQQLLAGNPV